MRWLLLLAPAVVFADGVQTCPDGVAGTYTCRVGWVCKEAVNNSDLVLTVITGQQWQPWVTIPPSSLVKSCAAGRADRWVSRAQSGATTAGSITPPSPVPAGIVPAIGDTLWWSPVEGATNYHVYHGTNPGTYEAPVSVATTRYSLAGYGPGTHYFAVTALMPTGESPKGEAPPFTKTTEPSRALRCTAPVTTQVGDVTQASFTCTYQ